MKNREPRQKSDSSRRTGWEDVKEMLQELEIVAVSTSDESQHQSHDAGADPWEKDADLAAVERVEVRDTPRQTTQRPNVPLRSDQVVVRLPARTTPAAELDPAERPPVPIERSTQPVKLARRETRPRPIEIVRAEPLAQGPQERARPPNEIVWPAQRFLRPWRALPKGGGTRPVSPLALDRCSGAVPRRERGRSAYALCGYGASGASRAVVVWRSS